MRQPKLRARASKGPGATRRPMSHIVSHFFAGALSATGEREKAIAAGCDEFDTTPIEIRASSSQPFGAFLRRCSRPPYPKQPCLRQMPTSRFWRIDAVVFAESQNMPGGGNSGVTSDRIVSGHGPRTDAGITSRLPLANTPLRRFPAENAGKTAHLCFLVDEIQGGASRVAGHEPWGHHRTFGPVPSELRSISALKKDRRRALVMDILAGLLAHIQNDAEMRGPPGPAGPRGEQGPPGKLPLVKLWVPETVFYTGDVLAYEGGAFQAKRDTGQPPSHADWICLAAPGRDGKSVAGGAARPGPDAGGGGDRQ
jgi:hypothetical protein